MNIVYTVRLFLGHHQTAFETHQPFFFKNPKLPVDVFFSFYHETIAIDSSVRPSTFSSFGNSYSQHN